MKWEELDHQMAEDFIYKVFKTLYGNQYENYSYDDVLEKITMQTLGVSDHNAQRYKDIERVFNEFLDKHRDKIEGKIVEESRFRDIQAKWLEHEQKQSGLNKLRNRTLRQYELGQNDFVQRFGNVKLSDLNTKQACKNFISNG